MNALVEQQSSQQLKGAARPLWTEGLTDKMVAFVEHYVSYRNATQAYDFAYDAREGSYETRRRNGHVMLHDPRVQAAVKARAAIATHETGMGVAWLLERFLRIANADPRELIGLKVGCCRRCYGEGHEFQWRQHEYLEEMKKADLANEQRKALGWKGAIQPEVPYPDIAGGFGFNATLPPLEDCPHCHGEGVERFVPRDTDKLSDDALLLYGGVKVKKDGYEIIIADQSKAAELAGRIMGAFNDKLQVSGTIGAMVAVGDLRKIDPNEAAKAYRDMIAREMPAK
jgi:phage terminase small subunit